MFNLGEFITPIEGNYATDVEVIAAGDAYTGPNRLLERMRFNETLPPVAPDVDWNDLDSRAWPFYRAMEARSRVKWWRPTLVGWRDHFRWNLHMLLLKWKVII